MASPFFDIIKTLQREYNRNALVPVIGAGFSMPFKLPNWSNLLSSVAESFDIKEFYMSAIRDLCDHGDFMRAVDTLIGATNGVKTEADIQNFVAQSISRKLSALKAEKKADSLASLDIPNNYKDIFKYNFNTVLTLNYDEILSDFAGCGYNQNTMMEFSDPQSIGNGKNIIYVHGKISDPRSIVLAKANYKTVYSEDSFKNMLAALTLNRTFLFFGFSFQDEYIKKFLETVVASCNVVHYALMDETSVRALGDSGVEELNDKYHVKIIQYDDSQSAHVDNISAFISAIANNVSEESIPSNIFTTPISYRDSGKRYLSHTSVYICLQTNLLKLIDLIHPHQILELGFGGAQTAVRVAEENPSSIITVVNGDDDMIKLASQLKTQKKLNNINLNKIDARKFVNNGLSDYDFIFLLYNFHHIPDVDKYKSDKENFLRNLYNNMKKGSYLCIADDFLPERCDESSLEGDEYLTSLYQQRAEEYKASTFWSFLRGVSLADVFAASEEAEQSKIRETESGVKVQMRDGEYLIKRGWLRERLERIGFSVVIDCNVNSIGDAILLLKKNH